jgi:hypothetical protein
MLIDEDVVPVAGDGRGGERQLPLGSPVAAFAQLGAKETRIRGIPERLGVENLYHVAMWVVVGGDIVRPEPLSDSVHCSVDGGDAKCGEQVKLLFRNGRTAELRG